MTTPSPANYEWLTRIALLWTIAGCSAVVVIRAKLKKTSDELQKQKEFFAKLATGLDELSVGLSQAAKDQAGKKHSDADG